MEVKIIKDEKNNLIVETDSQTIAELLRVYLNEDSSVELAAWRKERPESNVVLEIITSGKPAKKALNDAAEKIRKEIEKYSEEFKKTFK